MAGLTITGFVSKSTTELQDEINAALLAGISPTLNLSSTSVFGEYSGINSSQLRQTWLAIQEVYASMDIEQAEGDALTARCKLVGVYRRPATKSLVDMDLTLAADTYPAGSLVVHVVGDSEKRFTNVAEIVAPGGAITGIPFEAEEEGAVTANANTITQIATGAPDLTLANNPLAAATGDDEETDAQLRQRWRESQAASGSTTVDAIRADLLALDTVTSVAVLENTDDVVDANGIASRGIGCYVLGGVGSEIVATIATSKAAGIQTSGSTSGTYVDSQGNPHTIRYTVPSKIDFWVTADVTVLDGQYPATEFETAEIAIHDCGTFWGPTIGQIGLTGTEGHWPVGADVIYSRILASIMRIPGVVDVTDLRIGLAPAPTGQVNLPMTVSQYANSDYDKISVTLTVVTAAP